MPLTGQAKTDYQREYMRRSNAKLVSVRPAGLNDNQWAYMQYKAEQMHTG